MAHDRSSSDTLHVRRVLTLSIQGLLVPLFADLPLPLDLGLQVAQLARFHVIGPAPPHQPCYEPGARQERDIACQSDDLARRHGCGPFRSLRTRVKTTRNPSAAIR